ncbi:tetratricopeptide repeat protein [Variovorax sp. LARHSF232]
MPREDTGLQRAMPSETADARTGETAEISYREAMSLAMTLHRQGKLDAAAKVYETLRRIDPRDPNPLHFLGVLCEQRGQTAEALALIHESIALDPTVPDWHNNLGNVLLESGRVDDAARAYEEAARLAPHRADVQNNLGVLRREQRRPADAEAAYRRAIELDPQYVDAFTNLGSLLNGLGRPDEAMAAFCQALLLKPRHGRARQALGMAYYTLGRFDEAVQVYREWLQDEPGSPQAAHHLAACSGEAVPQRATDAYVETVFDGFADSFDAKLAALHYRAPQLIEQMVVELLGEPRKQLAVLDAGCGTGLCGPLLAPYAKRLQGVDLSAGMLAKAAPRQVYDGLAKAELTAFMQGEPAASYDLIVSADTLCYFGDLGAATLAAARALAPGGWLVFTVEAQPEGASAGNGEGFHLQPNGRYSHRAGYLRDVLAAAGLAARKVQAVHLRTEGGKPVDGFVVCACKAPAGQSSS